MTAHSRAVPLTCLAGQLEIRKSCVEGLIYLAIFVDAPTRDVIYIRSLERGGSTALYTCGIVSSRPRMD